MNAKMPRPLLGGVLVGLLLAGCSAAAPTPGFAQSLEGGPGTTTKRITLPVGSFTMHWSLTGPCETTITMSDGTDTRTLLRVTIPTGTLSGQVPLVVDSALVDDWTIDTGCQWAVEWASS